MTEFAGRFGSRLGLMDIDESFTDLRQRLMDNGSVTELRYPEDGFGLRLTTLAPSMKVLRVQAPAHASVVSIEPRFNQDDPFGRQWQTGEGCRDGDAAAGPVGSVEGSAGDILARNGAACSCAVVRGRCVV